MPPKCGLTILDAQMFLMDGQSKRGNVFQCLEIARTFTSRTPSKSQSRPVNSRKELSYVISKVFIGAVVVEALCFYASSANNV